MTNGRLRARRREPLQGGQAIRRAVAVLRTLAVGGERGVPLAEVVQATSLARPTVHRIVHVLIEEESSSAASGREIMSSAVRCPNWRWRVHRVRHS
ncbi:helix-turn-helix domain-containing protein [Bradyrhizobium sp. RDT10]